MAGVPDSRTFRVLCQKTPTSWAVQHPDQAKSQRATFDLRKLADLETRSLEQAPIDVAELLQEAVALAHEQPGSGARTLALMLPQAPGPVPNIFGDWDLLFLATFNLLDNALKFTRPGDTVEVRASEDGALAVVEVADTGPGIPVKELPRV